MPKVRLDLTTFNKDTTDPVAHEQFYLILSRTTLHSKITDDSNSDCGTATAAVFSQNHRKLYTCCLSTYSSIYTAELRVTLVALRHVYFS